MPVTYKKIASVTVTGTTQATIQFSNIPGTYTDLILKVSARSSRVSTTYDNIKLSFNGAPSGTSYNWKTLYSIGTTVGSQGVATDSELEIAALTVNGGTASTFSNGEFYIPNYAGSTNKSVSADSVTENNTTANGDVYVNLGVGLWSNTAAITSIVLTPANDSFQQYSTATLYGISKS